MIYRVSPGSTYCISSEKPSWMDGVAIAIPPLAFQPLSQKSHLDFPIRTRTLVFLLFRFLYLSCLAALSALNHSGFVGSNSAELSSVRRALKLSVADVLENAIVVPQRH